MNDLGSFVLELWVEMLLPATLSFSWMLIVESVLVG